MIKKFKEHIIESVEILNIKDIEERVGDYLLKLEESGCGMRIRASDFDGKIHINAYIYPHSDIGYEDFFETSEKFYNIKSELEIFKKRMEDWYNVQNFSSQLRISALKLDNGEEDAMTIVCTVVIEKTKKSND